MRRCLAALSVAGCLFAAPRAALAERPGDAGSGPLPSYTGVVKVHVDSDDPGVRLFRLVSRSVSLRAGPDSLTRTVTEQVAFVCRAPCDQVVDGRYDEEYYFDGNGMPVSSRFRLRPLTGKVTIAVKAGDDRHKSYGGTVYKFGFFALGIGGVSSVLAYATDSSDQAKTTSIATAIGGALVLTTGIVWQAFSRTTYDVLPDGAQARGRAPRPDGLGFRF